MTVATSKKTRSGCPALEYVHRRRIGDWIRPSSPKPAYTEARPIKSRLRYHNRALQAPEVSLGNKYTRTFTEDVATSFEELASQWREETKTISAIEEMAIHPAYQRIIGMGPAVIPHIMKALEERPDNWFWALRAITGTDPVQPEQRGWMSEMAKVWIEWAHANHIEW